MVCIDLSKAFDSLPVDGLLSALESAGLTSPALSWFRSYLSGRTQRVKVVTLYLECYQCPMEFPKARS